MDLHEQLEAMAKELRKYFSCLEAPSGVAQPFVMMNSPFALDTGAFMMYLATNLPCYHNFLTEVIEEFPWLNDLFEGLSKERELLLSPKTGLSGNNSVN